MTDNLAFVCTNLALYVIDLATHKTVWSDPIVGRLALSAQGVLYVAGQTTLTAFNLGGAGAGEHVQPPSGLSYPGPQTYYPGAAIQPMHPTVTGAVLSYSVSPPLPAGLILDPVTGAISGTPVAGTAMATCTVTAQNSAGQTTFGLQVAVVGQRAVVVSGDIVRTVVLRTPVSIDVSVQMSAAVSGTLYARVTDPEGGFASGVAVTPGAGGAYTLELTTSTSAPAGVYASSVTISFCDDAACNTPAKVASLTVPFSIDVITAVSAWPGDNLTTLSPWPGVPDWTTFQGNPGHTGYVPVTLDPNRFATRWQRTATERYGAIPAGYQALNSVTISGGLFFDAEGVELLASREHDGAVVWRHDFSSLAEPSTNPPAVSDGVVYIAAGQGQYSTYFFGFDAVTGAVRFQSPMTSQFEHYLAPTVGADAIYTNGGDHLVMFAFDAVGHQLFTTNDPMTDLWTPGVDATGVYSYTGSYAGGGLRVVDPPTGVLIHSNIDPTFAAYLYALSGSPVLGAPGSVFVANYPNALLNSGAIGNTLLNFDVTTESIRWQVAGDYPSMPAYRAGVLYVANNKPTRLEARSETTGSLSWSWVPPQPGETTFSSEVLVTDNLVFVCTNLAVYAIDTNTHKAVWSYPIVGRLALSAQGVLYVAGQTTLTAFNVK